jgi:2,4'-dihydroxyacetophenone dioxygenase
MAMTMPGVTEAVHLGADDIPWVELGDGSLMRLLQVRIREGLWIVHTRFNPGYEVQTHKHTGPVWGYTNSGAWKYKEYDYVNRAGSFLYEPAGSIHTLMVPPDTVGMTDVWFQIYGANLNLDPDGNIDLVTDASTVLRSYMNRCEKQGLPRPNVVVD